MKIAIGCDHAGFHLKEKLIEYFSEKGYEIEDLGAPSSESVDYPDFVHPLASQVNEGILAKGVLICGTGNGVAITANKYANVRCGLCWNDSIAGLIRRHNDANVVALPARFITESEAFEIVETFLTTEFEGGRHKRRVDKIFAKDDVHC